ncbi:MAG: toll/interleukin-1 receptor domain-containing protein [Anaerolineae bacterium]|nr:toll/interleukin-1 receptor domain-containing protein [Anaerolineae bacterium]
MTGTEGYRHGVYVSHAEPDRDWVREVLLPRLEGEGLRVCVAWRDFQAGASRAGEVERTVVESARTLLVLTPAYLESEWAAYADSMVETLDPAARKRRLIPLLKEACALPLHIGRLTYVDFADRADEEIAWRQLLTALGAARVVPGAPLPHAAQLYGARGRAGAAGRVAGGGLGAPTAGGAGAGRVWQERAGLAVADGRRGPGALAEGRVVELLRRAGV